MDVGSFEWVRECDARGLPDPEDVVVWISVQRFDAIWSREDPTRYITTQEAPPQRKVLRIAQQVSQGSKRMIMPHVGNAHGWGLSDGRHRFCWFRAQGCSRMPVTVYIDCAEELQRIAAV